MKHSRKRKPRIQLPAGCSISEPSIHPSNWKQASASCKEDWYIFYRFYDPVRRPDGLPKALKGMNAYHTVAERRRATEFLLADLLADLHAGYNPITGIQVADGEQGEISEYTPLPKALEVALKICACDENTKADIRSMLNWVPIAIRSLGWQQLPVGEVRKKHIRRILDKCGEPGCRSRVDPQTEKTITVTWSADKFNKYRSYLMILFGEIAELEAIESNPCRDIKKKKTVKKKRTTLTAKQRRDVDQHLRSKHYYYWRLLHIFFHSGARETEIMAVRRNQVKLDGPIPGFTRLVKKDRVYREVFTPIKDIVLDLWRELLSECGTEDYLFAKGFRPGPRPMLSDRINKVWKKLVKDELGIDADFYSLKHSNSTETKRIAGSKVAAEQNAHKTTTMVDTVYDVDAETNLYAQMKSVNNPFVPEDLALYQ